MIVNNIDWCKKIDQQFRLYFKNGLGNLRHTTTISNSTSIQNETSTALVNTTEEFQTINHRGQKVSTKPVVRTVN